MMKVSVIIPTYNERENIGILIPSIEKLLSNHKIQHEIIVVDDSSPDNTAELARDLNKEYKNIRVLVRKEKSGIGSAIRDGYNIAKNDILLSIDSDLSFKIDDIIKLLKKIEEGYDVVVGSRHIRKSDYKAYDFNIKLKRFVSRHGNKITSSLVGIRIKDFSANFRAMKKSVWEFIETKDNTNSILLEMIVAADAKGYKVAEIPVEFRDRRYGKSKLNLFKEAPKFFSKSIAFRLKYKK